MHPEQTLSINYLIIESEYLIIFYSQLFQRTVICVMDNNKPNSLEGLNLNMCSGKILGRGSSQNQICGPKNYGFLVKKPTVYIKTRFLVEKSRGWQNLPCSGADCISVRCYINCTVS